MVKRYDLIKQATGKKVRLSYDGDLGLNSKLRRIVQEKTPVTLIGLTKGGMATIEHLGIRYSIPPRNIIIESNH